MAFEAFLNETHRRPPRTTRIGFVASVALHGPPLGWFVATWLTHAMLIGSSAMYPETVLNHTTYYVPISFYGEGPGGGNPTTAEAAPGGTHARSGLLGRSGRAGRRGLVAPRDVKRLAAKTAWNDPFLLGSYASNDPHGAQGSSSGTGDDRAGNGNGSGLVGQGRGGGVGAGGGGNGMLASIITDRSKDKNEPKKAKGSEGTKEHKGKLGDPDDDHEIGSEIEVVTEEHRPPVRAAYISQDSAAYYRTHDDMPGLPAWLAGHREYAMLFRICVSTDGTVSNVVVLKSANEEADQVLCNAIQKWRYRPRIVDGSPRPFCHPIRIVYSRP
jgi:hypothetical protein